MKEKMMKVIKKVSKWNDEGKAYDKKTKVSMDFSADIESTVERSIIAKIGNYDVIEPLTSKGTDKSIKVHVQAGWEVGSQPSVENVTQTIVLCISKAKLLNAFNYYDMSALSSILRCSDLPACYKILKEKIAEKIQLDGTVVVYFPDIVIIGDKGRVRSNKTKVNVLIVCPELEKVTHDYLSYLKDLSYLPFMSKMEEIPDGVSNIFSLQEFTKTEKRQIQLTYIFNQVTDVITSLNLEYVAIDPYFYHKFDQFKTLINQLWINILLNGEYPEFEEKVYYLDFYCFDDVDTVTYKKLFVQEEKKEED